MRLQCVMILIALLGVFMGVQLFLAHMIAMHHYKYLLGYATATPSLLSLQQR